jgi:hypothetical protein
MTRRLGAPLDGAMPVAMRAAVACRLDFFRLLVVG